VTAVLTPEPTGGAPARDGAPAKHGSQGLERVMITTASSVLAVLLALVIAGALLLLTGKDAGGLFSTMWDAIRDKDQLIDALSRATPLMFSAVAVAIGFKMNLFNIGVEGQYRLAGLVAAACGANIAGPGIFKILVTVVVAVLVGAAFASIAGLLKALRNVNEVVATIMLNGIAFSLIAFMLHKKLIADIHGSFLSTNKYPESAWFPSWTVKKGTELYLWVIPVILLAIGYHYLVNRSRFGYDLRASGCGPHVGCGPEEDGHHHDGAVRRAGRPGGHELPAEPVPHVHPGLPAGCRLRRHRRRTRRPPEGRRHRGHGVLLRHDRPNVPGAARPTAVRTEGDRAHHPGHDDAVRRGGVRAGAAPPAGRGDP
jgi:ABC-type uncharacterized transport system permease subunit